MNSRRRHSRNDCTIDIRWSDGRQEANGRIRNIGSGGAYIQSRAIPTIGRSVSLLPSTSNGSSGDWSGGTAAWTGTDGFGLAWVTLSEDIAVNREPATGEPNDRLLSNTGSRLRAEDLVSQVATILSAAPTSGDEQQLDAALEEMARFFRTDRCSVFLLSEDRKQFHRISSWSAENASLSPSCPGPDAFPWVAENVRSGRTTMWAGPEAFTTSVRKDENPFFRCGIQSQVVLPLVASGMVLGALICCSAQIRRDWSEPNARQLEAASRILALALSRRRAQQALEHHRRFWETLLDTIPAPVFYKDLKGRYLGCNIAFARFIMGLPKEKIIGATLFDLPDQVPMQLAQTYHRQDLSLMQHGGTQVYESSVQCADGTNRDFLFTKAVYYAAEERPAGIVGVMLDITKRRKATEALKESEARYRRLFEDAVLGIFQSTVEGRLISVNPALADMFGYPSPETLVASVNDIATDLYADPADRSSVINRILDRDAPVTTELRFRKQDGSDFTGNLHLWKIKDAEDRVLYLEGFIEDISDRKKAEDNLRDSENRLRHLSSRLLEAQENLRRRISMEIHDDLGQSLAVLKLHLVNLSKRLRKDQAPLKQDCGETLLYIDDIIEKTRRITRDLSPSIIEDLKLCGTLEWMVHEFRKHAGINISLEMDMIDNCFATEAQVVIYRIFQEALNNIVKHAAADRVAITIQRMGGRVVFAIEDNGIGFALDAVWQRHAAQRGMGLAAMNERARMLGGSLDISSRKRQGTRIILDIPVRHAGGD